MCWVSSGLVTKQKPAAWLTGLASAMACFRSGLVSTMHLQPGVPHDSTELVPQVPESVVNYRNRGGGAAYGRQTAQHRGH